MILHFFLFYVHLCKYENNNSAHFVTKKGEISSYHIAISIAVIVKFASILLSGLALNIIYNVLFVHISILLYLNYIILNIYLISAIEISKTKMN